MLRSQKKLSVVTDTKRFVATKNGSSPQKLWRVGDDRQFFLAAKHSHLHVASRVILINLKIMRWRDLLSLQNESPLPEDFFETPRRVHFIGAGGIGMSALALLLKARGHNVSGSDERAGDMTRKLRAAGVEITIGHDAKNVENAHAIFYSSAIPHDNPEWIAAIEREIPRYHRSQLMAQISNAAQISIAVSGTHGKSTTSAMIAHILTETGHNPTAILGAVYPPFDSNLRIGDPDLVVVEADESDGSFTLLEPTIAVVLNVEPEHLENYDESEAELWRAFEMFAGNAKYSVLNQGDVSYERLVPFAREVHAYNFPAMQIIADNMATWLPVPGAHNRSNALGALKACECVEVREWRNENDQGLFAQLVNPLLTFAGTLRRFERKGEANGVLVYDDYGHHPTEVKATLEAAREFLNRPIVVVFQPHRYSRTQALYREFGESFGAAETIVITQLYSAHEEPIEGVSGRMVYDEVRAHNSNKAVFYAETLDDALELVKANVKEGDAVLTMGAGTVTTLGARILEAMNG